MNIQEILLSVQPIVLRFISDEDVDLAVSLVKQAADEFDTAERREWVVDQIVSRRPEIPERIVRWLVEMAVVRLKAEALEALEQGAEELKNRDA